jgi:site-specific DNA-methyltransferase (adenine-specific)
MINDIHLMDCLEGMNKLPDESVDLIVTSPPYDEQRTYKSDTNLLSVGEESFRILKDGGIMVMVIQDQTKNFGKSCTTFRTIVDYVDKIGFKLFECVIWKKDGRPGVWWNKRFRVDHEYVLIFLKGEKPKYFNKESLKIPAKSVGQKWHGTTRKSNGDLIKNKVNVQSELKCRGTVWEIQNSRIERNSGKLKHPATFPDKLVKDIISCFSTENEIVMDPFLGSGTTTYAAKCLNRQYIGFEIDEQYFEIAKQRMGEIHNESTKE